MEKETEESENGGLLRIKDWKVYYNLLTIIQKLPLSSLLWSCLYIWRISGGLNTNLSFSTPPPPPPSSPHPSAPPMEQFAYRIPSKCFSVVFIWWLLQFRGIFYGLQCLAFPRFTKVYVKGVRAPGEFWLSCRVSMNICCFVFSWKWNPLINYVSAVAASITMATLPHHRPKLIGATPRTEKPLFWVTTSLIKATVTPDFVGPFYGWEKEPRLSLY